MSNDVRRYVYDPAELRSLSASIEELHTRPSNSITPDVWYLRTRYVTRALPEAAEQIDAAQARITQLEAALHEIADFSEQFIGDDEDGDERMYKVNQIADTALANPEAKT